MRTDPRTCPALAAAFLCLAFCAGSCSRAFPQEPLRLSLAGPDAAFARRLADASLPHPNLRLGHSTWAFSAALALQATDNFRAAPDNPQADLSFRPELGARMRLPLSDLNTLKLDASAGGLLYLRHPQYNRPFVAPGSQLDLNLYLPNCWLDLYDRFAIADNPYADPTVASLADYARLDNSTGLTASCDLNRLLCRLTYDHLLYASLARGPSLADGDSDTVTANAAYAFTPAFHAGLELGAALLRYSSASGPGFAALATTTSGTQANAGVFLNSTLSSHLDLSLSAGYSLFHPDNGLAAVFRQKFSGVYAQLVVAHRVNSHLDYSLSAGRLLNFGFFGGLLDQSYIRLDAQWHLLRETSLSTAFHFQHAKQLGFADETFDWFGPSLSATRRLTAKLNATLSYQLYWRTSELPNRDYTANLVTAAFQYQF